VLDDEMLFLYIVNAEPNPSIAAGCRRCFETLSLAEGVSILKKLLDNKTRFQYILNAEPNPSIGADVRAALTPSILEGVFSMGV
jgi:hypothetical protein